jgi:hypothetical protein
LPTIHPEPPENTASYWIAALQFVAIPDKSNGYEEIASIFISGRGQNVPGVRASVVADWSQMLQTVQESSTWKSFANNHPPPMNT